MKENHHKPIAFRLDRMGMEKKFSYIQKQPPELFHKKRCSKKFRKILRKTPVPESLF